MGVKARIKNNGKYHNRVGRFFPQHPEKIVGNPTAIVFKSKLELRMMAYLDNNPKIVQWCYETFPIKYVDMSSNPPKVRNYWIDFTAAVNTPNGIKKVWIEVKSKREVTKPKTKSLLENLTWIKNQSKWQAARKLAAQRGFEFLVITEDQLI